MIFCPVSDIKIHRIKSSYIIFVYMKYFKSLLFLLSIATLFSCNDETKEEDKIAPTGRISGHVKHHADYVPNTIIYIKYGTVELPGTNPSDYDDQVTATGANAYFEFIELKKGPYYIFGIGMDDDCSCEVIGGTPIILDSDSDVVESILPVTE